MIKRIGVVASKKATDALLCKALQDAGFDLQIIHYTVPPQLVMPWLTKRMRERGFTILIGHLLLALYLRAERFIERLRGISPWKLVVKTPPSWAAITEPQQRCYTERSLVRALQDVDAVLFTDAFRLSHRLFRTLNKHCLQIVWGSVPNYLGDSGGYWAYTQGDPVQVTVVARTAQFRKIDVRETIDIPVTNHETLRTIKMKQAVHVALALPSLFRAAEVPASQKTQMPIACRFFYAPTLWTHLATSRLKPGALPRYAFRTRDCIVERNPTTL